jgi:hypothetical protein
VSAAEAPSLPLTEQLAALLNVMFAGCRGGVSIEARSLAGVGRAGAVLPFDGPRPPFRHVPLWLLGQLEPGEEWGMTFSATSRAMDNAVQDLGALFVTIATPPAMTVSDGWQVPADVDAAARARLVAFPLPPTIVLNDLHTLAAVWALEQPLDVARDGRQATELLTRLAARLGGAAGDDVLRTMLPLPGTLVRNAGTSALHLVELETLNETARYSLAAIETAMAERKTKT